MTRFCKKKYNQLDQFTYFGKENKQKLEIIE